VLQHVVAFLTLVGERTYAQSSAHTLLRCDLSFPVARGLHNGFFELVKLLLATSPCLTADLSWLKSPHAGGCTVLALRSTVPGESCSVEHLHSMLALFGPVAPGQPVALPEPESVALQAHAFRFERAEHAEQAAQVRKHHHMSCMFSHLVSPDHILPLRAQTHVHTSRPTS
jgi:hypothetical protein